MAKKYTIIPTASGPFAPLDLAARAVFGLIWDRYQLSRKTNEEQASRAFSKRQKVKLSSIRRSVPASDPTEIEVWVIFCIIRQTELVAETGLSERTIRRCIRDLEDAEVIRTERAGVKGANRYYINPHVEQYFTSREYKGSINRQ